MVEKCGIGLIQRQFFSSCPIKNFSLIGQVVIEKIDFLFQKRPYNFSLFFLTHLYAGFGSPGYNKSASKSRVASRTDKQRTASHFETYQQVEIATKLDFHEIITSNRRNFRDWSHSKAV